MSSAFESEANSTQQMVRNFIFASNLFEGETSNRAHEDALNAFITLQRSGLSEQGFLHAHGTLMSSRESCEEGEKGMYRYRRVRVGDRLMPPASLVPELTRDVIDRADRLTSLKVADLLVKIHPFADGNGRIARLVLCHLNISRGEEIIPFEGEYARGAQQEFVQWITNQYPECDEDGNRVDGESTQDYPWEATLRRELIR